MNSYELAILYDPDLEIDLDKAADKVKQLVSSNGGKITAEDNWGKRKLAYKIKGHDMAVYVFYAVDMPPAAVKPVESTLNITDEVIRFLITKPDVKAIKKAEAVKAAKAKSAKKREEHAAAEQKESEDKE
jgi:small subunit ribosomal protein S6